MKKELISSALAVATFGTAAVAQLGQGKAPAKPAAKSTSCKKSVNDQLRKTVEKRVKAIIVEQFGVKEAEVTPNARFIEDLGADSLDTVELVLRIEEEFDIRIPDESAEKLQRVCEAYDFVEQRLRQKKAQRKAR